MNKTLLYLATLLVMVMMTTACNSEDELIASGDEMNVTFTATLDQSIDSRAISDGSMVDKLVFIAYDENGNEIAGLRQDNVPVSGGHATVNTRVVKGHRYTFAFWAQNSACQVYSFSEDYKSLNVDYSGATNDESRDAFYATCTDFALEPVTEPFERDVVLHRPFAQLNFGTTALDINSVNQYAPATGSQIVIDSGVYSSLNLIDGVAGSPVKVETAAGPFIADSLTVDGKNYFYLSMNYLLVNNERTTINGITMTTIMNRNNIDASYDLEIESLPVQRNYRTNVVGHLITQKADFYVTIDNSFSDDVEIFYGTTSYWDGTTVEEPVLNGNTYNITRASQLAWFQDHAPADGSTINLKQHLNFKDKALRPLLAGAANVTIEGNGYYIQCAQVSGEGYAALFGNATGLTVNELTVDHITVTATLDNQDNAIAGAVVATAGGTTTLNNVRVQYSTVLGACMVGGLVGNVAAGGNIAATGCDVSCCTIENTEGASRRGLAGGMVGYIASGAAAEQAFTSCEVYNTLLKARMSEASLTSGKLIGAIQGAAATDVVRINSTVVMVNFQGLDEAAAAQQSSYGHDQIVGANQQGNGHVFINNVEI